MYIPKPKIMSKSFIFSTLRINFYKTNVAYHIRTQVHKLCSSCIGYLVLTKAHHIVIIVTVHYALQMVILQVSIVPTYIVILSIRFVPSDLIKITYTNTTKEVIFCTVTKIWRNIIFCIRWTITSSNKEHYPEAKPCRQLDLFSLATVTIRSHPLIILCTD